MNLLSSSQVFLDIETYPIKTGEIVQKFIEENIDKRLKNPEKIEENRKKIIDKLALNPITGMISLIGIRNNGTNEILVNKKILVPLDDTIKKYQDNNTAIIIFSDEKDLLEYTIEIINNAIMDGCQLVTFNGKKFDMPFIFYRALINKIADGISSYQEFIKPYSYNIHLDLRQFFEHGSLNDLAHTIAGFNIDDASGADVINFIDNDLYEEAIDKLIMDLIKTESLFEMIKNWLTVKPVLI